MAAIKLAIIALVIAGLIFRTRTTVGLLLIGGLMTLIGAYPLQCLAVGAISIVISLYFKRKESAAMANALDAPGQE
jgi:ABC-type transport system involved in multi-copper enzyme maturation permease subunit